MKAVPIYGHGEVNVLKYEQDFPTPMPKSVRNSN